MCGRYVSRSEKQRIAETFHAHIIPEDYDPDFVPDYNVAPTTLQPVVRLNHETGDRELTRMRWGLIPFWAKNTRIAYSTINARAETLASSPSFREALKRRRCLIPADAFYEWKTLDKKTKQPYAIALSNETLIGMAGLWDRWKDKATGVTLDTYTIITTDPNDLMEPFHDRMPAILDPRDYQRWLEPAEASHLPTDLLRPYPSDKMKTWKVSPEVGNTRNNYPKLLEPLPDAIPSNGTLFD
jgi:putative SOS response-associated peptidase YedK